MENKERKLSELLEEMTTKLEELTGKSVIEIAKEMGIEVPESYKRRQSENSKHYPASIKIYDVDENQKEIDVRKDNEACGDRIGLCCEFSGRPGDIAFNLCQGITKFLNETIDTTERRIELLDILYNQIKEEL